MRLRDKALQAGNGAALEALVETRIVPHADFRRAAQSAVGPAWRAATPGQQDRLTVEFRTLLLRTYSRMLAAYESAAIQVLPARVEAADDDATVRSTVKPRGQAPVALDYAMERVGGEWRVYDVLIDSMSLVMNYRATFRAEIERNGIDGLIAALAKKNRG